MSHQICRKPNTRAVEVHGMVTVSQQMRELFARVRRVARTDSTVLIRGESGTGKELVANMVHECSARSRGPFRAVNCAMFTSDLLASELFGHVRGAFTGAVRDRPGLFKLADNGSIFLDEVGEIPVDIQARMLRVLQERAFVPLGGSTPQKVDVRVISATNKALREEVDAGQFREDLMYRIRVVVLRLPPLRERLGDIEALTWRFISEFNERGLRKVDGIESHAMDALLCCPWPGNIRELRNNIEQAFAIGEGPVLRLDDLTTEVRSGDFSTKTSSNPTASAGPSPPPAEHLTVADLERERIVEALRKARGRKGQAAQLLGWSRSTLWRRLKAHGMES